jgi:hypothetical protein
MHRVIMKTPEEMDTDHINHDQLDNRRENLRICTRSENKRNSVAYKTNTSGFKGVTFSRHTNKWQAQIKVGDLEKYLGYFSKLEAAAHAYDDAAKKYYGDFAKLNFA